MSDINREYAESVVCRWAEAQLGLPSGSVARVTLLYEPARAWSEVTFEDENLVLGVFDADGVQLKSWFVPDPVAALFELIDLSVTSPLIQKESRGNAEEETDQ